MKHVAEGLPDLGVRLAAPPGHAGVPCTSGGHREEGQSLGYNFVSLNFMLEVKTTKAF